jgi:hypothetical protein
MISNLPANTVASCGKNSFKMHPLVAARQLDKRLGKERATCPSWCGCCRVLGGKAADGMFYGNAARTGQMPAQTQPASRQFMAR